MRTRIKEVRNQFGDTLQSLSQKIDYDYSNLSKIERGIYKPSLELLDKIATVYNININTLLVSDDTTHPLHLTETPQPLFLDGQQLSKEELDLLIQSIRLFRKTLNAYKPK
ncbi:helix-turn-helix domain-containing protein (plasmid) [Bacillus cereus]|uniref:helix-turn-helix domain-containing protein n=1 Tax=Bacillus cereus TaxID=1396 RepID=UPI001F303A21|nr:helix-turn-helix transcriptional regulator [Bacillus cereus]UIJ69667.1 helix-turn-helix domain-containing protein [Bacillus cereus]